MHGFLRLSVVTAALACLSACASSSEVIQGQLATQAQDQRVLGTRVSRLEERTDKLEEAVGLRGARAASPGSQGAHAAPGAARKVAPAAETPVPAKSSAAARRAQAAAPADPIPVREYVLTEDGRPIPADTARQERSAPVLPYLPNVERPDAPSSVAATPSESGPGLVPVPIQKDNAPAPRQVVASPAPAREKAPARAASPAAPVTGKSGYDKALALYYNGQYDKAAVDFAAFVQSSPGNSLVPNALYWQGECQYALRKYDAAILLFKDVAAKYPKHPKAAASLLKAGYAYERLKDTDNAHFYWQLLLDDFPKSEPARLARQKMGKG